MSQYESNVDGAWAFIEENCMVKFPREEHYMERDYYRPGVFGIFSKKTNKVVVVIYSPAVSVLGDWDFEVDAYVENNYE